jgi:hypothetical protein
MPQLQPSEVELSQLLARAREIAQGGQAAALSQSAVECYLQAVEEVGLAREAVLPAMREQRVIPAQAFSTNELVFASSLDDCWYPAMVQQLDAHGAAVRLIWNLGVAPAPARGRG